MSVRSSRLFATQEQQGGSLTAPPRACSRWTEKTRRVYACGSLSRLFATHEPRPYMWSRRAAREVMRLSKLLKVAKLQAIFRRLNEAFGMPYTWGSLVTCVAF